jgi:hypothetical protein
MDLAEAAEDAKESAEARLAVALAVVEGGSTA